MELLRRLDLDECDVSLFVLTGQGEMVSELPSHVHLLNADYNAAPVLDRAGKRQLAKRVLRCLLARGTGVRLLPYMLRNLLDMLWRGAVNIEKLLWRALSDGAPRWDTEYDLAVAYLEGGSTYYVADHVQARKKAAFVHIDYAMAGYTRKLDLDCYSKIDRIFTPAESTLESFLKSYPEYGCKSEAFPNMLDVSAILRKSRLSGGFADDYNGTRILTVARLTAQKALDVSVEAMKLLKDAGADCRWYVLGEGDQRHKLERRIHALGLEEDFILCGAVDNPYPYFVQADLYVHASRFEGKSVAIQEAQVLECPVLASDCGENREAVSDGVDGRLCPLTPEGIRNGILWLMDHPAERARYAEAAGRKQQGRMDGIGRLLSLLEESGGESVGENERPAGYHARV